MPLKTQPPAILRFGVFELDLRAGELRKKGTRIKLQGQPFQVLAVLLQHRGEVVSREQLRSAIWSTDTFVDFDNALNTAINKLRDALGDASANPRFIETLPRRGYRFIAPVRSVEEGVPTAAISTRHYSRSKIMAGIAILLGTGILVGALVWRWRNGHRVTEKDTIVLADFANLTGDKVFDGTLRLGLSVQLQQSPFLNLISDEQIHQTLRMMGQKTDVQLTPEIGREICQRTNSTAVLDGSIALIGSRYDLIIRAVNCASGGLLASAEVQANDIGSVLEAVGKIASEMRRKLGESLSTVQKYSVPLAEATTPSLEGLKFFSLGEQVIEQSDNFAASLPYFQKAIERDPNFALAYWALGDAYSIIGESTNAAQYEKKAFDLRTGVSELEKLIIEGNYYYYVTGDLIEARRSFELIAKTYPRNAYAHTMLADISNILGQYNDSLNHCLDALRLAPYNSVPHRYLVLTYLLLDRIGDSLAAAHEAHAKDLDSGMASVLYGIAFYKDDVAEMARQVANAVGKPGEEDLLLELQADSAAYFGHLQKARGLSLRAIDSAERTGEKEAAGTYYAVSALREALFGNVHEARQQAERAQRVSTGRDLDYGVALAFAYAGDANRAQELGDNFGRRLPEDTVVRLNYLPTLHRKVTISRSKNEQALETLETAAPYELGLPSSSRYNWPNLYPTYVRGEAYLGEHHGPEAAAEFQKILDHRNIVLNEPIGALAHLQLGRAYVMGGDFTKAKAAYQDFLILWKDADPDIPIYKQAKAEYAKLH